MKYNYIYVIIKPKNHPRRYNRTICFCRFVYRCIYICSSILDYIQKTSELHNITDASPIDSYPSGNDENDIKHEYGHHLQFLELGKEKYTKYVAIPSLYGYWSDVDYKDYYSQPWEYGADLYGGVTRDGYTYHEDAEEKYKIYWDSAK